MDVGLIRSRAPLRLGLGGGGSDVSPYCDEYGGIVLNATINRFCHVTVEPRDDGQLRLDAADLDRVWEGEAPAHLPAESGAPSLMRGVYNRIVAEFNKGEPLPVSITSYADAPAGSGLGTSSAMVVALLSAFRYLLDLPLGAYDLAHMAFEIERKDLGFAGGKQDQYAAAFGGVNFMEFYADDRVIINPLRVKPRILQELEASLVIYFTGQSRESANIIQEQQKHMTAKDAKPLAAIEQLKKVAVSMKESLLKGDIEELAELLGQSWEEKKKTAAHIANSDINAVYDAAMGAGALGGKVSGAGGGGFMMFIIDPVRRQQLLRKLAETGSPETCQVWSQGVETWRNR